MSKHKEWSIRNRYKIKIIWLVEIKIKQNKRILCIRTYPEDSKPLFSKEFETEEELLEFSDKYKQIWKDDANAYLLWEYCYSISHRRKICRKLIKY